MDYKLDWPSMKIPNVALYSVYKINMQGRQCDPLVILPAC